MEQPTQTNLWGTEGLIVALGPRPTRRSTHNLYLLSRASNPNKPVEPKIVSVEVKKPMVVKDVRKVKKTQYVKQKVQPANQKSGKFYMWYIW